MALVNINTLVPQVAIHTKRCPNPVIEQALLEACIDLCEKSAIWRVVDTLTTASGIYEYPLSGLPATSEIAHIITAAIEDLPIFFASPEYIQSLFPTWPDTVADRRQQPQYITFIKPQTLALAAVPDDAYDLKFIVSVKPTRTATQIESTVLNEAMDAIVSGAIHKVLMQRDNPWFDPQSAVYHGKMWRYNTGQIRAKVNKGLTRADVVVALKPFA